MRRYSIFNLEEIIDFREEEKKMYVFFEFLTFGLETFSFLYILHRRKTNSSCLLRLGLRSYKLFFVFVPILLTLTLYLTALYNFCRTNNELPSDGSKYEAS